MLMPPLALVTACVVGALQDPVVDEYLVHMVPPLKVRRRLTETAPAPVRVPPLSSNVVIVLAPLNVSTPPDIAKSTLKVAVPVIVSGPPVNDRGVPDIKLVI